MRKAAAFTVALILAVFLASGISGCLQRTASQESPFIQDYRNSLNWSTMAQAEACKPGSCWCYVCKNGTNLFGAMRNLIGGYCFFQKNCTPEVMAQLSNKSITKNASIRTFMLGQGPTFSDFSTAQQYCNARLSMAIQWLVGTNETPYQLPSAARSMCLLSKDVVPVYILYSKGENLNATQAQQIGKVLGTEGAYYVPGLTNGPVGPVVVVTEMNFNASQASQVAAEVRGIDQYCNKRSEGKVYCQIAVGPKAGDTAALDAVMNELVATNEADLVDLVAYGLDGRYMSFCGSDGSCNPSVLWEAARKFSRYSLYTWGKPSLIPYILIEPGTTDVNGYVYSEEDVVETYGLFFPKEPNSLKAVGVMGVAPYSFNGSAYHISNPLECVNCDVASTPARLRAWYAGCQAFTNDSKGNPSGLVPIAFPNESGGFCGGNMENANFMYSFTYANQDVNNQLPSELKDPIPKLYSCDECIAMNASGKLPFNFTLSAPSGGQDSCNSFTAEIDAYAGARSLDPTLVRAFMLTEAYADLDPCSIAKVCSKSCLQQSCVSNCFPITDSAGNSECYARPAYDDMSDPSGACPFASSQPSKYRWCGLGLMQVLVPPYTFWPAAYTPDGQNGQYFEIYNKSGLKNDADLAMAKACNPQFNPFNASDALCMGTAKMSEDMKEAQAWLARKQGQFTNRELLGISASDFEKERAMEAYIAAHMYVGDWYANSRTGGISNTDPNFGSTASNGDYWAQSFYRSTLGNSSYCASSAGQSDTQRCKNGAPYREPPTHCYGYTDFIKYMRECQAQFIPGGDRGAKKMGVYYWLVQHCDNSYCPDGKRFFNFFSKQLPASGTPYVPDAVSGTQ